MKAFVLKETVKTTYGSKGEKIVNKKRQAIDKTIDGLKKILHPAEWANAELEVVVKIDAPTLSRTLCCRISRSRQRPACLEVCCRRPRPAGHDE